MVIIGARGHAKEILQVLKDQDNLAGLFFFDDFADNSPKKLFDEFSILTSLDELKSVFESDNSFVLGTGRPAIRFQLKNKIEQLGGQLTSVISKNSHIGSYEVNLGDGLNIMDNVFISNSVSIGNGCLLNYGCSVHHDSTVGNYCELSPKSQLLGNVTVGNFCTIGAGAIILPGVVIADYVVVGAGAVVTKNIDKQGVYTGIPAKLLNERK